MKSVLLCGAGGFFPQTETLGECKGVVAVALQSENPRRLDEAEGLNDEKS